MTLAQTLSDPAREPRIPLSLKLAYTAFCLVMVPVYLAHTGRRTSSISATRRCC